MELDRQLSSLRRRSVSFSITSHGKDLATITLMVVGKRGIMSKDFILKHDSLDGWELYASGSLYSLNGFSEVNSILKSEVAKLNTLVNKIA